MSDAHPETLPIHNFHPKTMLSMDSSFSSHDDSDGDENRLVLPSSPLDINLPISVEFGKQSQIWNDTCDLLNIGLSHKVLEQETIVHIPKGGKKCAKRADTIWGAWFFFSFYFKPILKDESECKVSRDCNGLFGYDKSDLRLDTFLVQHDMENIYMWVFKDRPEGALGKMQLRSYMNGHSREGERPFPFSANKGFVRSHKMQRKHYRGLSNPQCVHGIELVKSPDFTCLDESNKRRWMELTGRELSFSVTDEASDFESWRILPPLEVEVERRTSPMRGVKNYQQRKIAHGIGLSLSTHLPNAANGNMEDFPAHCKKHRKECCDQDNSSNTIGFLDGVIPTETPWVHDFAGAMKNVHGPVTGAKTIYEDEKGFLIIVSLPFADLQRVKVTWRNTVSHGIVKVICASTAGVPFIKRHGRTFKLKDGSSELCPPGDFVREISLPIRIPDDGVLEAYCDETGTVLEINVPKQLAVQEEHEVPICLRPSPWIEPLCEETLEWQRK